MSFYKSLLSFLSLFLVHLTVFSQEVPDFKRSALAIDITQMATNEVNLSYELSFSSRRSLEIALGIIYVNDALEDLSRDMSNSHYFSEHGFSARVAYKLYRRQVEDSKWRDYLARQLHTNTFTSITNGFPTKSLTKIKGLNTMSACTSTGTGANLGLSFYGVKFITSTKVWH